MAYYPSNGYNTFCFFLNCTTILFVPCVTIVNWINRYIESLNFREILHNPLVNQRTPSLSVQLHIKSIYLSNITRNSQADHEKGTQFFSGSQKWWLISLQQQHQQHSSLDFLLLQGLQTATLKVYRYILCDHAAISAVHF